MPETLCARSECIRCLSPVNIYAYLSSLRIRLLSYADTSAMLGIEVPSQTDFVALGFPATAGQMIGSKAVIASDSAASNGMGMYSLDGKSPDMVKAVAGGGGITGVCLYPSFLGHCPANMGRFVFALSGSSCSLQNCTASSHMHYALLVHIAFLLRPDRPSSLHMYVKAWQSWSAGRCNSGV
jgi:hypothetical protein